MQIKKTEKAQAMATALVMLSIVAIICLTTLAIGLRHNQIVQHNVRSLKARYWAEAGVQMARDWLQTNTVPFNSSVIVPGWNNIRVPVTGAVNNFTAGLAENDIDMRITVVIWNVATVLPGTTEATANYRIESTVTY